PGYALAHPIEPGPSPGNHIDRACTAVWRHGPRPAMTWVGVPRTLAIVAGFSAQTLEPTLAQPDWQGVGAPGRATTVDGVFCLAALVPSPPILVPELCGGLGAGAAVAELRAAALAAVADLAAVTS